MDQLAEVGLEAELLESEPGRASVVVRIEGADPQPSRPRRARPPRRRPGQRRRLAGGPVLRRGARRLHLGARRRRHEGHGRDDPRQPAPPRAGPARSRRATTTFVFFADEEAGGLQGSHWIVDQHPRLVRGGDRGGQRGRRLQRHRAAAATGEPTRAYLVQTAEKGIAWLRLHAHGRAGHGSVPNDENAVVRLAEAVGRIAAHHWPREYIASVRGLLDGLSDLTGTPCDRRPRRRCCATSAGRGLRARDAARHVDFTMLDAGLQDERDPADRHRALDCRFLPGHEDDLMATVRELAGEYVEVEVVHRDIALESPFDGDLVGAIRRRCSPRTRAPPCCRTACPAARTTRRSPARHHRLRVRAVAAARRPGLRPDVPRHRRAGAGRLAAVRRAGAGPVLRQLLRCRTAAERSPPCLPPPAAVAPGPPAARARLGGALDADDAPGSRTRRAPPR